MWQWEALKVTFCPTDGPFCKIVYHLLNRDHYLFGGDPGSSDKKLSSLTQRNGSALLFKSNAMAN